VTKLTHGSDGEEHDQTSLSHEEKRIREARDSLPPLDSIFEINDFEVRFSTLDGHFAGIPELMRSQAVAKDLCPDAAWDYYWAAAETRSSASSSSIKRRIASS
jgi:hypothetical protein